MYGCRPSLVSAAADCVAMAVIREARQLNLWIPGDLSIMSFRGYEFGELMEPQLDTVRFENEEAGIIAARTLIQMCRREPAAGKEVPGWRFEPGGSTKNMRICSLNSRDDSPGK